MKLIIYAIADGKRPALEAIQSVANSGRSKIFGCLESIELLGFDTPRVEFRHIEWKRWELKTKAASGGYRIFYVILSVAPYVCPCSETSLPAIMLSTIAQFIRDESMREK